MFVRFAFACLVLSSFVLSSPAMAQQVRFRLDATDVNGDLVDTVQVGDTFFLNAYTEDIGSDPAEGVFAAYLDVLIDPPIASAVGPVEAGDYFQNASDRGVFSSGLLNNYGGFSSDGGDGRGGLNAVGPGEFLVFSAEMQADSVGQIEFTGTFANESPTFDVLVFSSLEPVLEQDIEFGSFTLQVAAVPEPSATLLAGMASAMLMLFRRTRSLNRRRNA